jgi:hypothetical protein
MGDRFPEKASNQNDHLPPKTHQQLAQEQEGKNNNDQNNKLNS